PRIGGSAASGVDELPLPQRGLERPPPAHHVRVPAQQCPALTLGHATPHSELDAVVERVGQALVPHRAAPADPLGDVLLGPLDEQRVRIPVPACCQARPVGDHAHLSASPSSGSPRRCASPPAVWWSVKATAWSPDHHAPSSYDYATFPAKSA